MLNKIKILLIANLMTFSGSVLAESCPGVDNFMPHRQGQIWKLNSSWEAKDYFIGVYSSDATDSTKTSIDPNAVVKVRLTKQLSGDAWFAYCIYKIDATDDYAGFSVSGPVEHRSISDAVKGTFFDNSTYTCYTTVGAISKCSWNK
jgi:hypothetical protein